MSGLPTGISKPLEAPPPVEPAVSLVEQMVRNLPHMPMKDLEKLYIQKVLVDTDGCIMKAGRILNLSRATIYRKIGQYGLARGKRV